MNKIALTIVFSSSVALFSCSHQPKQPPPGPVPVNLDTVKAVTVLYYDKYPSTTAALSQVNIYPQVQGYITGIFFQEGARVKKGQKLYEIDSRLYRASVDQAEANLKVAQGTTVQSKEDADRYEYLNKYKAVAKQLYDHAVITLQNAQNSEKAAAEAVKTAKTNLAFSVITAPFDGTIGFSQVKMGNLVTVGNTILNTISTDNPMAVDFLINEKQLPAFEKLEQNQNSGPDSLFTILLPDNSLYPYTGKISVIDRAVNSQTGAIRVRLVFPNDNNFLKAGMSCVVRVHNQEKTPQILIPSKAVVEQMGEYFVFVDKDTLVSENAGEKKTDDKGGDKKKDDKEDDKAKKVPGHMALQRKIMPGQTIGGNVVVKSGLVKGDVIVIDGVQLLHDGSRIAAGKAPNDTTHNNMQGTTTESPKKN